MRYLLFILILALGSSASAMVSPTDGSHLNTIIVGFDNPAINQKEGAKVEIAEGNFGDLPSFSSHVIITTGFSGRNAIVRLPHFGVDYTWRVYTNAGEGRGKLHHFSVGSSRYLDTSFFRLKILRPADKFASGYLSLDGPGLICDMDGKPIWYFPLVKDGGTIDGDLRDLKISPRNTITCLYKSTPYEITWSGKILWKKTDSTNTTTVPQFHHDFVLLNNGHYMVLGNDNVYPQGSQQQCQYGTIMEYDKNGKLLWKWASSAIFQKTHFNYGQSATDPYDVHQNSCYFDEKRQYLYVGFKNVSQILKIKYPSGKVVATYGRQFNDVLEGPAPFYEQHTVSITNDGLLCVFDNHNMNKTATSFLPHIVLFQEPTTAGDNTLRQVWDYAYFRADRSKLPPNGIFTTGGSVREIEDKNLLVSMCDPFSNMYIVDRNKQLHWEAITEKYNPEEGKWKMFPQYRVGFIPDSANLAKAVLTDL